MHQLLAHNPTLDDTFFVAKFLKGLGCEICVVVVLHKPRTVQLFLWPFCRKHNFFLHN